MICLKEEKAKQAKIQAPKDAALKKKYARLKQKNDLYSREEYKGVEGFR